MWIFLYIPCRQLLKLNDLLGRVKNSVYISYDVHIHRSWVGGVWFHVSSSLSGDILPATGFLPDQAHKVLGGSEGCSSLGIPQGGFPHPRKRNQRSRPWSTAGSYTDCCSKETEMADKSCCSRRSLAPSQVCSPRALCWWQEEYPGRPYVHLERKKRQYSINLGVHKTLQHMTILLKICRAAGQGTWTRYFTWSQKEGGFLRLA